MKKCFQLFCAFLSLTQILLTTWVPKSYRPYSELNNKNYEQYECATHKGGFETSYVFSS